MNNDLISRSELKKAFNKWWGCDDIPTSVVEDLIDDAPTVSQFKPMCKAKDEAICEEMTTDGHCNHSKPCPNKEEKQYEIKVNVPDDIKDKLIEELSKPRKAIIDEPKTVTDCIIAYGDGFESSRRLFESKCRDCDFRKFSETFINGVVEVMTKNGIKSVEQLSEILGKGKKND